MRRIIYGVSCLAAAILGKALSEEMVKVGRVIAYFMAEKHILS
jgi:hypothetical protein